MQSIIKKLIFKPIAKFHKWYDGIQEPKRFLYLLGFGLGPWAVLDIIGIIAGHEGFGVIGMLWILLLIASRFWWLYGDSKKYL